MTATEYVVLVDEQNREVGSAEKLSAHAQNLLHRAFSVFIFREEPQLELLIQQRALDKYHSPGLWTNTCCSHPRQAEDVVEAGERRLAEEMGIHTKLKDLGWFHYNAHFLNGLSENEIDHVLVGSVSTTTDIIPNSDEVHDYQWVTIEKLKHALKTDPSHFTPWLGQALEMVEGYLARPSL